MIGKPPPHGFPPEVLTHGMANIDAIVRDEMEMPVFVDLMMNNPDKDWGKPFYPVVY